MPRHRKKTLDDTVPRFHGLYREQILAEQVRQLYRVAPLGMVATVVNSLLVFFVMKDAMPYSFIFTWVVSVLLVTLLRGWLVLMFRSSEPDPAAAPVWARRFTIGLALTGVAWGSIGLFPFSELSMVHKVFLGFVLGGMAAGASSTFAPLRYAYAVFAVPALTPLALHFASVHDTFHCVMAAMMLLYGFLLWRISLHNHETNRTSLLLRFENREMIETLEQAKDRVERLNTQLVAEIEARHQAEAGLRAHKEELEKLVEERTADLSNSNEQLKSEIEERKQYEKALLESGERLAVAQRNSEAANRAKTEFLANMSHEMRTPLAGALGMIKLVLDMDIGQEERQLLSMAKRSTDSLLRIIADVLDFSRLEAGMMSFEHRECSVKEVARSALEVVSLIAREKGLNLMLTIADSVPERIIGDEGRLRQVLVNLLGNAVKFTEKGEIEVAVRRLEPPEAEAQRFILFSVRDSGVGIPADQLDRIFARFTQVDSSLTRRHGGTGLGLALTRQIVEKMGGDIWAESREGAGSTFSFTLPEHS